MTRVISRPTRRNVDPPTVRLRKPKHRDHQNYWSPALALVAAVVWVLGLKQISPSDMGSLGLISELSPLVIVGVGLLIVAMVVELRQQRPRGRALTTYTMALIGGVYGIQPLSEQIARLPVAWLHAGFIQYIAEHGDVLHNYDARFSWPGFFELMAFVEKAAGASSVTSLLSWAPAVLVGLAALGVRAIAVTVLGNGRAAWLATWIFLLADWTEQDYFSPQAVTFVLYLGALAVVLRHLVSPGLIEPVKAKFRQRPVPANSARDRIAAQAVVVFIALALAISHQLSPYVLGGVLLVLLFTGRLWSAWLPVLVLAAAIVWLALGAKEFWLGQLSMIFGSIGDVSSSLNEGFSSRFVGAGGRIAILCVRVGITAVTGLLALAGWRVLRKRGVRSWVLPLLAVVPFGLAALQPYGGEVLMRCFLFALPFMALLGGVALGSLFDRPAKGVRYRFAIGGLCLTLFGFGTATITARGGNDAYSSMSTADLTLVQTAYNMASSGQEILSLTDDVPLYSNRVGDVKQGSLSTLVSGSTLSDAAAEVLQENPDYVVVTPSQEQYGRIYEGLSPGWTDTVIKKLVDSGEYRIVLSDNGSTLLAKE
jgi:hypothetical protein